MAFWSSNGGFSSCRKVGSVLEVSERAIRRERERERTKTSRARARLLICTTILLERRCNLISNAVEDIPIDDYTV